MNGTGIVALFDANVLYPAPLRDFLVRLARTGLVGARWSDVIHEEWIRNLLKNRPDLRREQLERTRQLMEAAVPGALVEGFEYRIPELELPDPDDRHVLAAAIEGDAKVIVTFNSRDFPREAVAHWGIEVREPDDFAVDLLLRDPALVHAVARAQRSELTRPPKTVEEYLATLVQVGLERTAAGLRESGVDL